MNRTQASQLCRKELDKHGLLNWKVRVSSNPNLPFLGICMYTDKCIMLNGYHIDIHGDAETINTIKHEVAHALTPGHNHDSVWASKAQEIGCDNTNPCSTLNIPEHIINAIRSGDSVEVIVEEKKIEQVIRNVTHKVTRLQDTCPECGKIAKEVFAISTVDKFGNDVKLITLACFHIIKKIIPRGTAFDTMVSNDWKPEVKNCKHVWTKNQCDVCKEYKLFNFQTIGALATEAGLAMQKGFGIFDDMGLGKTVQALAVIKFHPDLYTPTLYITKSAITFQWFKQIVRWLGPSYLAQVISTSRDFLMPGLKSYIISYDLLRRMPREKMQKLGIKCVVLDECQQIKNPDSARTQEVRRIVGQATCKVIALSGTPWKNRGSEFYPVLNMMDNIKFWNYQKFLDTWVEFYYEGAKKKMGGIRRIKQFKELTADLIIRREYNEVMDEFPEINRMKLAVQLDAFSQSTYDESVGDFVKWYNEYVIGGDEDKVSGIEILAQMARMRHITGLAKIPATVGFVEEFIEDTDKKLVIFCHHQDVTEILTNALKDTDSQSNKDFYETAEKLVENGVKVFKYTSDLSDSERFEMAELFNKTPRAVMVASTLACGEGVDLQTCSDSILHERQWNPQNEDQATPGRFRRIGQTSKVVNITVPEGEGTIDQQLDQIVEGKRAQFHKVMNKGEMPVWNQTSFAKELAELIVKKHNEKNKGVRSTSTITKKATLVKK